MRLKFWKRSAGPAVTPPARPWPSAFRPRLEQLMDRIVPAFTVDLTGGVLTVTSDGASDNITVRTVANDVQVNNANVGTLSNVNRVVVNGNGGNDTIDVSALTLTFPASPMTSLDGGAGNDVIRGSSAGDVILGGTEADNLIGNGGNDLIEGGAGNDTIQGGAGADNLFGDEDTDKLVETGNVNFTLTSSKLTAGSLGTDTIGEFEQAHLTGGSGNNVFNTTGFSGQVSVTGGLGDDDFTAGSQTTLVEGAAGVPTQFVVEEIDTLEFEFRRVGFDTDHVVGSVQVSLTGSSGADTFTYLDHEEFGPGGTLNGGGGSDRIIVPRLAGNTTLEDDRITQAGSGGSFDLVSIEEAELFGDNEVDGDTINASGFSGRTTLDGGGGPDNLTGGSGADLILGGTGDDLLRGNGGNDTIQGGLGNDRLREDVTGNATLDNDSFVGNGTDTLSGIDTATITGDASANTLSAGGFSGRATLNGLGGDDVLAGGSGDDTLNGGTENDFLDGNGGNDTLNGGTGTDEVDEEGASFTLTNTLLDSALLSGLGNDNLISVEQADLEGTSGGDTLDADQFTLGPVTLSGSGGNDVLRGTENDDNLHGGTGNDDLFGNGGDDTLTGSFGDDHIDGGAGTDTLNDGFSSTTNKVITLATTELRVTDSGSTDIDSLISINRAIISVVSANNSISATGTSMPVTLLGGSGNDTLIGGLGADLINGNGGADRLEGRAGADELNGGDQNDVLFGNSQADATDGAPDIMNGDGGDDVALGADPGDVFNEGTGTGGLLVQGTDGDDVIVVRRVVTADGPFAVIEINGVSSSVSYRNGETVQVFAGKGNDIVVLDESTAITWSGLLFGEKGHDVLVGASRGDYLDGGDGDDTLRGRDGDDVLVGGEGKDALHGEAGADLVQAGDGQADWIYVDIDDLVAMDKKDKLIWV